MELALHIADFTTFGDPAAIAPGLAAAARSAEGSGFTTLTLMDHYFQIPNVGEVTDPMLEGYAALNFLAGKTERLQLGLLVTGVTYRHPGLLAKTVATLDVLSGGRALFGIGAAWYGREHAALGVPFPPVAERFERLEEALQICRQMWSGNNGVFHGQHYDLAETLCVPGPLQRNGPPILIGGMGEQKTLSLVARYGDACNLFDVGPEVIAHKIEVLKRHCDAVDRDIDSIAMTVIAGIDPLLDPDSFLRTMQAYADLGISKVWVGSKDVDLPGWVARVGDRVGSRLRDLSA